MRTTIDSAGRIVVPKQIRERAQLAAGGEVEITEHDGVIEIVSVAVSADIVQTKEGPVAVVAGTHPMLTDADVRSTVERTRR